MPSGFPFLNDIMNPVQAQNQMIDYGDGWQFNPQTQQYVNSQNGMRMNAQDYNLYIQQQNLKKQQEAAEAKRVADLKAQGLNPDGSPIRQAWDSLIDESTGKLKAGYTMDISGLDPSKWEGYQKYKSEALRTGPSAWAKLQQQQNAAATLANKEAAARQALSGMNQGLSNLAMRGGMSAGARGLASRAAGRDLLMARQQAARAGDTANLQTMTTDEANRINQLASLSSSEQNIGQFNKTLEGKQAEFNIGNLLKENEGKRAYNDMTYQEQMKKWAADKQAQATAASGGGGGKK